MEVTLMCAVVGEGVGRVFFVRADLRKPVGILKDRIKEAVPGVVYFDADQLNLYLAREDGRWLSDSDPDIQALKTSAVPSRRIRGLVQEHLRLDVTWDLDDEEYFGEMFEPAEGDVHVLAELPEDPDEWTRSYYGRRKPTRDESMVAWDWPLSCVRSWFTGEHVSKADKVD